MGLFGVGKKDGRSLEERALEVVKLKGLTVTSAPLGTDSYNWFNVVGIGASETDYDGALKHFTSRLNETSPAYVYGVKSGFTKEGPNVKPCVKISAIGYRSKIPV